MLAYKIETFVAVGKLMAHMGRRLKENAISRAKVMTHKSAVELTETLYTLSKI